MAVFRVTVHERGKRRTTAFPTLDEALTCVAAEVTGRSRERRPIARALAREIAPEQQIVARIEVRGRRVRGGVDVRGDGSASAFTGRWSKREVAVEGRETAPQALRRVLGA